MKREEKKEEKENGEIKMNGKNYAACWLRITSLLVFHVSNQICLTCQSLSLSESLSVSLSVSLCLPVRGKLKHAYLVSIATNSMNTASAYLHSNTSPSNSLCISSFIQIYVLTWALFRSFFLSFFHSIIF